MAAWEVQTRVWATEEAGRLVLTVYGRKAIPVPTYTVGLVARAGEDVWVETHARLVQEHVETPGFDPGVPSPYRPWLVTSDRLVGRIGTGQLLEWRWQNIAGCRVDLAPGREWMSFDMNDGARPTWTGAGLAPMAVLSVAMTYGWRALVDHPGLERLRMRPE